MSKHGKLGRFCGAIAPVPCERGMTVTHKLCTALLLLGSLGFTACQTSPSTPPLAASKPAEAPVETVVGCGEDNGGFGAPVRHFGEPTPFSDDPFRNPCWPE
jgi:hypothetical protein